MKDVETYTGELIEVQRVKSSRNGNPRFMVRIENAPICYTAPDSMLGYSIQNHKPGTVVQARIGSHYGTVTLAALNAANDYESRVQAYERQGMTRSDAQGVVDAEDLAKRRRRGALDAAH